ncbi:N-methylhydantoinase A/acetone carboxylase, beta subunit [Desulfosporosinus orientis DSM 765]|uniref:N-methylhydantoinase A/acetone carboxylase, beta subunit n=1 Tax=Desulfosporosinus orientis (strain ATCC 19365 / DSM 765 / NCIMB 8382 / VKM B-1628 / Singapore I) TaxID=768706 RepID=G7W9R6_DESOD|nr:hydantoinase/oxoprolinase family protein [Desulfosporosinus orientis]AET70632.1 N-methylhydantoinase A/acetone carboxylase, beta subunit [Desulfosporosinus orientis DSM 765]
MAYILGIDTGGTYTDGVILDFKGRTVVKKAKAFTTPQDLTIGIKECIDNLGELNPNEVKMVCLSTTLATNAIVEGRGGKVGLILIGNKPPGVFPAQKVGLVSGGHDGLGSPVCELDQTALEQVIRGMKGEVDTLAISGIFSIRNPEHENLAKELVHQEWDVPIVCAHELSSNIGLYERTVTACLNAKLLPIIADLLIAVKQVLKNKLIDVPIMIVKGDGSLISEEKARFKPIETILSGPAASIVGAMFLSGLETFLTLDMGGTTSDIGIIQNKCWRMHEEGAIVAGWRTHIDTAGISTVGLGGDSYITVQGKGQLTIGPTRVIPLSVVGERYPYLAGELNQMQRTKALCSDRIFNGQTMDSWIILKTPRAREALNGDEQLIIEALEDGPHNTQIIKNRIGKYVSPFALKSLEQAGIIGRISFTPTDALHCLGQFKQWNVETALAGARVLANTYGCDQEKFVSLCLEKMTQSLALAILQGISLKQGYSFDINDPNFKFFLEPFLKPTNQNLDIQVPIRLNYPVVAIGAPVTAYLPAVGDLLQTKVIIPEHSEVANAIGAAMGKVSEKVIVLIRPGYTVHAPWGLEKYTLYEEACDQVLTQGKELALENAKQTGIIEPELIINRDKVTTETDFGPVFIEEYFEIIASGYCQERVI